MTDTDLYQRRTALLAPTYGLFYQEPVQIVRADGVWMYDETGRAYLDAYNNVPVVGHCHPHVLERTMAQARRLNTHTRYLTDTPVELAEKLLVTFPGALGPGRGRVIFTCTGSEANDLAVRIAKAATGGTGFLITEHAYHGTTETIAGMSPSAGVKLGAHVRAIPSPATSGGPAAFAAAVRAGVAALRAANIQPAGLLVDTIFSSDGVFSDPPGFLAEAVAEIRAAGGLFIADEVQPGFARTGEAMWCFQRHGVVPDLVTMGKPMGNGHPIAALVAQEPHVAAFARQTRYFNTFGGNNVACAAALGVLEVIERESLLDNAARSGAQLQAGLRDLAARFPSLGEVRGAGLFVGVQVLATEKLDARSETARIVNGLRRAGVLIGSAGRNGDVLKIRPPLPIRSDEVALLVERLAEVLAAA